MPFSSVVNIRFFQEIFTIVKSITFLHNRSRVQYSMLRFDIYLGSRWKSSGCL